MHTSSPTDQLQSKQPPKRRRAPGAGRPKTSTPLRIARSFKATDIEWSLIQEKAKRAGYKNTSDFIRKTLLSV